MSSARISKYLKTLIDLGIVKRETPLTEKTRKKTIDLLADNFFRFRYRFATVNASAIDSGLCICFWQGAELPLFRILERRIYRGIKLRIA